MAVKLNLLQKGQPVQPQQINPNRQAEKISAYAQQQLQGQVAPQPVAPKPIQYQIDFSDSGLEEELDAIGQELDEADRLKLIELQAKQIDAIALRKDFNRAIAANQKALDKTSYDIPKRTDLAKQKTNFLANIEKLNAMEQGYVKEIKAIEKRLGIKPEQEEKWQESWNPQDFPRVPLYRPH